MKIGYSEFVIFCVILNASFHRCQGELQIRPSLDDLLRAIRKSTQFFIDQYDHATIGSLTGIRFAQGQLLRALEKGNSGEYPIIKSDSNIRQKIEDILVLAKRASKLVTITVKRTNPSLYYALKNVVGKPWIEYELKPQRIWILDKSLLPKPSNIRAADNYSGWGDVCMKSAGRGNCDYEYCWKRMTRMKTRLYYTTHQVLWLQVGLASGCQATFEKKARKDFGSLQNLIKILCSNVIMQMELIAQRNFPEANHDVFLEQGALCGGISFLDAVNLDWLREILKWRNPLLGCFNTKDNTDKMTKAKNQKNSSKLSKKGVHCGPHISGVGTAYLSVYLRLFLDPVYIRDQLLPSIRT